MIRACSLALLCTLAVAGCKPRNVELAPDPRLGAADGGARGETIPGLQSLRITPSSREATFDGKRLDQPPVFRAIGAFEDGSERDVSALVAWTLARRELGAIDGGRFAAAAIGGRTEVHARAGEETATAQLRIRLEIAIQGDVPDTLVAAFGDSPRDRTADAPELAYPSDGTVVPSNLGHLRYHWGAPDALDVFELSIDSDDARLRYYTRERSWIDDTVSSRFLAPSHPGSSVRVRVRGLASATPAVVYRSAERTVHVAPTALPGQALYWSSTARGIKRGAVDASHASRIVSGPGTSNQASCAGCHVVSRDGTLLAAVDETDRLALFAAPDWTRRTFSDGTAPAPMDPGAGMPPTGKGRGMMSMGGAPQDPPAMPMAGMADPPRPIEYGFGSFSPDGGELVYAAKGKLRILDTTNGQESPRVRLPGDTWVAHPDWSPDGAFIAVAYGAGKAPKGEKLVRGSAIGRLSVLGDGTVGELRELVRNETPEDTLAFPAYSPDGSWIAFARSTGASKDNATTQLWIVRADGSAPPVLLERANRPAEAEPLSPPSAANGMPTWGPSIDESQAFLAFSSARAYADVLVAGQRDQLWATAIDLERLAGGIDPSAPAFWLPFQDPTEHNHRAFWSSLPSECVADPEICDDRDDDCDGEVDEGCCERTGEDCSTAGDDDCDGVANEGCNCAEVEDCDNGADDDCDERVDEDCKE